jgi:hypothetical protein
MPSRDYPDNSGEVQSASGGMGLQTAPAPTFNKQDTGNQTPTTDVSKPQMSDDERMARLDVLAASLMRDAIRTWGLRQSIEERWLEDLRQYNGAYDEETLKRIKGTKGSELFINHTRPKCRVAAARLGDMMFPTDDKNWNISPTPVPELMAMVGSKKKLKDAKGMIIPGPADPATGQSAPLTEHDKAQEQMQQAQDACDAMEREIDDQLTECDYTIKCREVINDSVILGTGVLKGPVVTAKTRKKWQKMPAGNGKSVHTLQHVNDARPAVEHVDPWNFFPDMAAANMDECRFVYERKYLTAKQLMNLASDPYYLRGNIVRALKAGAKVSHISRNPTMEKRANTYPNDGSGAQQMDTELYEIWEYHGPLDLADLRAAGQDVEDDMEGQIIGCVVFCGQVVIKAYMNPMETGELPYAVFNYERDEASIFGYGVPYRMRGSQRAICAGWRAMMDNAALATGPQIIINKRCVEPADGDWTIQKRKVWHSSDAMKGVRDVFASYNIECHQEEMAKIIEMASQFADIETGLPQLTQGEQGSNVTKTVGGLTMLNNNVNIVTRSVAKNFDDGITTRTIKGFYDWNMQFSEREDIKGDFEVDARGSSALLAKELQAQNLMALGLNFAPSPVFGPMTKYLNLYRHIVRSMNLSSDEVVVSDAEYKSWQDQQAKNPQQSPEVMAEQSRQQFEMEQLDRKTKAQQQLESARHQNRLDELSKESQPAQGHARNRPDQRPTDSSCHCRRSRNQGQVRVRSSDQMKVQIPDKFDHARITKAWTLVEQMEASGVSFMRRDDTPSFHVLGDGIAKRKDICESLTEYSDEIGQVLVSRDEYLSKLNMLEPPANVQ